MDLLINRMWTVVNFQSDNSVAAVPEFWYRNSMCAWPKKFNSKLITKRAKPNTLEFSYFKAKVLFKNIDTYLKARALAHENSDVSSNDILYNDFPKAIKKKSIFKSDSLQISSPPIYADSDESNEDANYDKTSYMPTNKNNTSPLMSDDDNHSLSFEHQQISSSSCKKLKFDQVKSPSLSNTLVDSPSLSQALSSKSYNDFPSMSHYDPTNESPSTPQTILHSINKHQTLTAGTQLINDELENKLNVLTSALRGIERNVTVIKHEIKNFHDRLDSVVTMQETILDKLSILQPLQAIDYHYDSENDGIIFIDSDATLNLMEEKLKDNIFRSKVV